MPEPPSEADDPIPTGPVGVGRWLLTTDNPWVRFVREVVSSVAIVLVFGVFLFGISGVWPPLVAVESGSMEPHMYRGDLVFVMDEARMVPSAAQGDTGVVPYDRGVEADYRTFGSFGDVVVYDPPDSGGPPIIHRAHFWVDTGENWYDRANPSYIQAESCGATPDVGLPNCPAPNAGFITKGDANPVYDQVTGISRPVKPAWITGTAEVRIPYLGFVRLKVAEWAAGQGTLESIRIIAGPAR